MALRNDRHIGWRKEAAALIAGLVLGTAWEAAHAEVASDAAAPCPAGDAGLRSVA